MSQTITAPQLVADNPNPLAPTFNMSGIDMRGLRKIVIPSQDHEITRYAPIAKVLFEQYSAVTRVEFSNMNDQVSMTLCLDPRIAKGRKDFELSDKNKNAITGLVSAVQTHLTNAGHSALYSDHIIRSFNPKKSIKAEDIAKPEVRDVFTATMAVLNPMAASHGGSFEVVGMNADASGPLSDHERKFLSDEKDSVVFEVAVFGSCSGCTAFFMTYGQSPRKIATALKEINPSCSLQVRHITPTDTPALIFK